MQHSIDQQLNELAAMRTLWGLQLAQVRTDRMKYYQLQSDNLKDHCPTLQRDLQHNLEAYKENLLLYECQARITKYVHDQVVEEK